MTKKLPLLIVIASLCLCGTYVASKTMYLATISNFSSIIPGEIAGTRYSFVAKNNYWSQKQIFLKNNNSNIEIDFGSNAFKDIPDTYVILQHRGQVFIIIKRPTSSLEIDLGLLRAGYLVWNITGDQPYFVNSMMSCDDPKLLDDRLVFRTVERCESGRHLDDQTFIILR